MSANPAWRTRAIDIALSAGAVLLGLIVPPVPVLRRRAYDVAGLSALIWLLALVIFFALYAGVGLLLHLALWFASSVVLLLPKQLAVLDAELRARRLALARWVLPGTPTA